VAYGELFLLSGSDYCGAGDDAHPNQCRKRHGCRAVQ
jgi:hypothetical protein